MKKVIGESLKNYHYLPKYLSISSFESNYIKDFENWKKQYKNGNELDHLNQLRLEYGQFIEDDYFSGEIINDIKTKVKRKISDEELRLSNYNLEVDENGFTDFDISIDTLCQLLNNRFEEQFKIIEYNQQDFENLSLKELCEKYQVLDHPKTELRFFEKDEYRDFVGDDYYWFSKQSFIIYPYVISNFIEYFWVLGCNEDEENRETGEIKYSIGFDYRKYHDFEFLVKNMLKIIDKKIENIKNPKQEIKVKTETLQEQNNYKTTTKENIKPQQITPIKLELNQSQIVYLFQQLEENGYLKLNQNPKLWNLVSKYFVDMNNKPLKNIHQIKDKLANSNTGKPKNEAETIEKISRFLDKLKD